MCHTVLLFIHTFLWFDVKSAVCYMHVWWMWRVQLTGDWLYAPDFMSKAWTPDKHATCEYWLMFTTYLLQISMWVLMGVSSAFVRRREWERKVVLPPRIDDEEDHLEPTENGSAEA
jgi:hypothetical protein